MAIKNRNLFAHVDFFPREQFKLIGEYDGQKLLLIGKAQGYGDPIVAISQTDEPSQEDLVACDLYELMKLGHQSFKLNTSISND